MKLDEFAARKRAAAETAALDAWKTEVDRHDADQIAIGNDWSRARFDGDFYLSPAAVERPSTSLVFVQSRNGNTGARDPTTLGGGEADKHLIYEGLSRAAADAVLAGAETIRGGGLLLSVWHPELIALRQSFGLPRHPVQIVATLSGLPLDDGMLFNLPDVRVVLVTVASAADLMRDALSTRPWIETVRMNTPHDLAAAFHTLRRTGIERISAIGGRTLAAALLDAGLVQDVYLTTSARNGGEPDTPLSRRPLDGKLIVRKHGSGADEGVRFEHLRLRTAPSRSKSEI
ncbi:MAG TPA: dihydrofolate reductase family protein [Vicinamibacterales bacterium]|nr:dihydrofolate reductase family protein [Vicinamibacterales bacterium]